jgi:hypothetical protein
MAKRKSSYPNKRDIELLGDQVLKPLPPITAQQFSAYCKQFCDVKKSAYQTLSDNADAVATLRFNMLAYGALDDNLPRKVVSHFLTALAHMEIATQSLHLAIQEQSDYDHSQDGQM